MKTMLFAAAMMALPATAFADDFNRDRGDFQVVQASQDLEWSLNQLSNVALRAPQGPRSNDQHVLRRVANKSDQMARIVQFDLVRGARFGARDARLVRAYQNLRLDFRQLENMGGRLGFRPVVRQALNQALWNYDRLGQVLLGGHGGPGRPGHGGPGGPGHGGPGGPGRGPGHGGR